jgi:hypothetical protein
MVFHRCREVAAMSSVMTIEELLRLPSPAPAPQALACDGDHLWMGSWETQRMYGIDRTHFTVFEEANAPGRPVGMVSVGDELRVIVSEDEDCRFIRRYVPGHGFKDHDRIPCPDDAGSFLAYDGRGLWLSQRYHRRVLELDVDGTTRSVVRTDGEILGIAFVEGTLYLSLWFGKDGGCKIARANAGRTQVETIGSLPFAAVSLTHDGMRFWTNDPRSNSIVAFSC